MKMTTALLLLMTLHVTFNPDRGNSADASDNLLKYLLKPNSAGPSAMTFSMTFSNNGRYLAAGGLDKSIRIWDVSNVEDTGHVDSPRTIRLFDNAGSAGWVFSVRFAPNDQVLAVGTNVGGYLIDVRSGEVLMHFAFPKTTNLMEDFAGVAFSPDGRWLATGHERKIRLWDLGSFWKAFERGTLVGDTSARKVLEQSLMKSVVRFDAHQTGREGGVFSLSFCKAKIGRPRLLSAADDNAPVIWEFGRKGWEQVRSLECGSPTLAAVFAPASTRIVTASNDHVVRTWDDRHEDGVDVLHGQSKIFNPPKVGVLKDGATIALGNWPNSGECAVFSSVDGRQSSKFLLHDDTISALAVHPSDLVATSGSQNTRICLWRPDTGRLVASIDSLGTTAMSVAFSADGKSLAYGSEVLDVFSLTGALRQEWDAAWDLVRYEYQWGLLRSSKVVRPLNSVFDLTRLEPNPQFDPSRFTRDESEWKRHRLNMRGWEIDRYSSHKSTLENNHLLVVMKNGKEVNRIPSFNGQRIEDCSLTSLGTNGGVGVVLASSGGKLGLHDIETGNLLREFRGQSANLTSVAVSPNDEYLVGACRDQTLRLWSLKNPGESRRIVGVQLAKNGSSNEVEAVVTGSAAATAGIRKGDVIESVNDAAISSVADLQRVLAAEPDASVFTMTIRRNGTTQSLKVQPKSTKVADIALPLLTIFLGRNGQFIAWTEQGYYTCSPGSDGLFGWQVNQGLDRAAEFYPAKSFQAALYRPDLVKSILESHGKPVNQPETLTIEQLLATSTPPTIRFLNPAEGSVVDTTDLGLEISVTHPNQAKIEALDVTVNGRAPRAIRVRPKIEGQVFKETIPLVRGKNIIGVRAVMSGGILSDPRSVSVSCTAENAEPGNENLADLYVLAVGVAKYPVRELELRFAAKDATDLVAVLKTQRGKQFSEVHTKLIVDQEATRANVLEGLAWLKSQKLRPQDHVVLFMSGHGGLDESENYCFVTVDSQVAKLGETGLRWSDIRQSLGRLAGRPFLFLDTCHAGGAAGTASVSNEVRTAYNGVLRDAANDYSTGIITVASCLPHELSYEDEAWSNGAFTKSLVEALQGKGDLNQNGILTISETETYISQRVEELTQRRQSSCLFKTNSVPSNLVLAKTK